MRRPMNVQIIVTPGGERLAVLPEAELEALIAMLDDGVDGVSGDAFVEALASEMEATVPPGFLDRLLAGANPIKVGREYRGLSLVDLAEAAAVPAPRLAALETGEDIGSPAELHAIAVALKLSVDDLV